MFADGRGRETHFDSSLNKQSYKVVCLFSAIVYFLSVLLYFVVLLNFHIFSGKHVCIRMLFLFAL